MKNTKNSANRRVLGQLLHGSWRYFIACIAASLLFTAFELVIPQIIRVSVDSLIGSGPVKVAAARPVVQALGGVDYLRQNLWIPAAMMAGSIMSRIVRGAFGVDIKNISFAVSENKSGICRQYSGKSRGYVGLKGMTFLRLN